MRILKIALAFHAAVELTAASGITSNSNSLLGVMRTGSSDLVVRMIEEGADVNESDYGWRPLHEASSMGDLNLVELLLANGANPLIAEGGRITPILIAAKDGNLEIVKRLAEIPDVSSAYLGNALIFAAANGRLAVVEYLLGRDASIANVRKKTNFTARELGIGIYQFPAREFVTPYALLIASSRGYLDVVSALVNHGARADYFVLVAACSRGQTEIVRFLIDQGGADMFINEPNRHTMEGFPLGEAARAGSYETVALLIERGATRGLNEALLNSPSFDFMMTKLLLENGADPNTVSRNGVTRLMGAMRADRADVARLLLDHGADLRPYGQGLTPLDLAIQQHVTYSIDNLDAFVEAGLVRDYVVRPDLNVHQDTIRRLLVGGARNTEKTSSVSMKLMAPILDMRSVHARLSEVGPLKVFSKTQLANFRNGPGVVALAFISLKDGGVDLFSDAQFRDVFLPAWHEEKIAMVASIITDLVFLGCRYLNLLTVAPFLAKADEDLLKYAEVAFRFLAGSFEKPDVKARYRTANGAILNEMIERSSHVGLRPVVKALFSVYHEESQSVRSLRSWGFRRRALPDDLIDLVARNEYGVTNPGFKSKVMQKLTQAIRKLE